MSRRVRVHDPFSPVVPCSVATGVIRPWRRGGRHYGAPLVRVLGFTHRSPCAATLHTVFRRVDREAVEATLGAWAEGEGVSDLLIPRIFHDPLF